MLCLTPVFVGRLADWLIDHVLLSDGFRLSHKFSERLVKENVRCSQQDAYDGGMEMQINFEVDFFREFRKLQAAENGEIDEAAGYGHQYAFLGEKPPVLVGKSDGDVLRRS